MLKLSINGILIVHTCLLLIFTLRALQLVTGEHLLICTGALFTYTILVKGANTLLFDRNQPINYSSPSYLLAVRILLVASKRISKLLSFLKLVSTCYVLFSFEPLTRQYIAILVCYTNYYLLTYYNNVV